ncbi:unnamed protein product [Euphydryas editha]|uniref:DUF4817 domain-containing protein n=1 Tax=Euphydryas editha TaxID=104508 RepID=A0AAU9URS4_EUPED|nr:unnamed protein product [Euphydryas editha]
MERYTIEQHVFIVEHYLKNNESLATVVQKLHIKYGRNSVLISSTVKRLIEKFRETGSVGDTKYSGRPKTNYSNVNIKVVRERDVENPRISFDVVVKNCKFQEALYSVYTLAIWVSMLKKNQLTQQLKLNDHALQREFDECIIEHQQVDADFSSKIILGDEAYFHLH